MNQSESRSLSSLQFPSLVQTVFYYSVNVVVLLFHVSFAVQVRPEATKPSVPALIDWRRLVGRVVVAL